jgi:hypothetical protein
MLPGIVLLRWARGTLWKPNPTRELMNKAYCHALSRGKANSPRCYARPTIGRRGARDVDERALEVGTGVTAATPSGRAEGCCD